MGKRYKIITQRGSVSDVGAAVQALVELGEELQERADNMPENLQSSDLYYRLEEAAQTLTGLDEPDLPGEAEGLEISYSVMEPYGRAGAPRWMRGANEVAIIEAAQAAVEALVSEIEEKLAEMEDGSQHTVEFQGEQVNAERLEEIKNELEELVGALGNIADEAGNVEYPGRN